jgi:hypothetical protein
MEEISQEQVQSVSAVIRNADARLYKTLVWAPVVGRMVYFLFFACVAITGYVWRVDMRLTTAAEERKHLQEQVTYNYKLYQQLFRDVHKGQEPPPILGEP